MTPTRRRIVAGLRQGREGITPQVVLTADVKIDVGQIVLNGREVVARGLADTEPAACEQAK